MEYSMDEQDLLRSLPQTEQYVVFKRLTLFLRSREIEAVMERIAQGDELFDAHLRLGLLHKYRGDLRKILLDG
jgi:hypothetical protein